MNENEKMPLVPDSDTETAAQPEKLSSVAPVSSQTEPSQQPTVPENSSSPDPQPEDESDKKSYAVGWILSHKKIVLWGVIFFLFVYLTGITPVSKVPLLRSLVRGMGYSQEETQSISFFKALFSWNEHAKLARGEADRDLAAQRMADIQGDNPDLQRQLNRLRASSLINVRALEAQARAEGQRTDKIKQVIAADEQGENLPPLTVSGTEKADTQANNATLQNDVFFGAEADTGVARNKQDGFDSVKALAKVNNPYKLDGSASNWMGRLVDKAFWADSGIQTLLNEVANSTKGARISRGGLRELGETKARQDIFYAYLTSRAGSRTNNVWLQKTLAAASFMGADLDRQMLSFSSYSGISLDEDAMIADMETIQLRLEMEKNCKEFLNKGGDKITQSAADVKQMARDLNTSFPATCGVVLADGGAGFMGQITQTISQCKEVNDSFKLLKDSCQISYAQGKCDLEEVTKSVGAFKAYCEEKLNEAACDEKPAEEQADCKKAVTDIQRDDAAADSNGFLNSEDMNQLIDATVKEDFISTPDWEKSLGEQQWES